MHEVSHQGKVASETSFFDWLWSVKLLVKLECRILWSSISLERINLYLCLAIAILSCHLLSNFTGVHLVMNCWFCLISTLRCSISGQLCAPGQIGFHDSLIINISGRSQFIPLSGHCYFVLLHYFLASFIQICRGSFSYDLLILSCIMLRIKILMILNIMITMIIMMIMMIRKIDIPENVFEEPLLVKNLSFRHLLIYMYTIPNMSFFVHCRLLSRTDDVKLLYYHHIIFL